MASIGERRAQIKDSNKTVQRERTRLFEDGKEGGRNEFQSTVCCCAFSFWPLCCCIADLWRGWYAAFILLNYCPPTVVFLSGADADPICKCGYASRQEQRKASNTAATTYGRQIGIRHLDALVLFFPSPFPSALYYLSRLFVFVVV